MEVLYEDHPSMFKNSPFSFVVAVLLIPAFGLGLIILLWWFVKCKATKVTVTENELMLEEGILSKSKTELSLENVRTVQIEQSFGQRIFGTGDLKVYTSGDEPEIQVAGMPEPETLKKLVKG